MPISSISEASAWSWSSMTNTSQMSRYPLATSTQETCLPNSTIILPAGPVTASPPTIGLTQTFLPEKARILCRTPGRARIGPRLR